MRRPGIWFLHDTVQQLASGTRERPRALVSRRSVMRRNERYTAKVVEILKRAGFAQIAKDVILQPPAVIPSLTWMSSQYRRRTTRSSSFN